MSQKQRFNLHLPGLLKVLAEHLYSTKKVGIRELIQNAHDSCVRRKVEENDSSYRPRIELEINPGRRTLVIRDNGCGLTAEEIDTYLATIGRGYTRELREKLSLYSSAEAAELIGQFGLGFLSAFLLAGEVVLTTQSFKGGPSLRWHSTGDEHYEMTKIAPIEVGTNVELKIKPAASFVLQERNLVDTVRTYADFVPTPIYLKDERESLNIMTPPWEAEDQESAVRDYIHRAYHNTEALWILPLKDWQVDLGHDTMTVPLKGFLFVPPGSVSPVIEFGDLSVYIRRMFICERERDLLPPWARFVRGVIECPALQPTASREGIHQDENFESVRQALEDQLGQGLRELARNQPDIWKRLVRGHADIIVSWSVKDNEFFEKVKDIVTFRTSRGQMSLPEYLEVSGGSLYYITNQMGSLQDQVLAEGRDVPAIDASLFFVQPFLEKYASRDPDVGLVQLDGEASQLLRTVPETPYAKLLSYFRNKNLRVRVANFKPADVPALMVYPQGAEIAYEAGQAIEAGELPGPLAGLVGEYVNQKFSSKEDLKGTLYLNAGNVLIRRLVDQPLQQELLHAVLELIYQSARLFLGRMMTALDAIQAFKESTRAIEGLLKP